jgi:cell division septation protein DedD
MMERVPVITRTQRRLERRQMLLMVVLVAAVTVASFFLGVMVGERGGAARQAELAASLSAQLPPPSLPAASAAGSQRLTFYQDLPKGNAAPLGSGINLPKTSPVPPPVPTATAPTAQPAAPAPAVPVPSAVTAPPPSPPPPAAPAATQTKPAAAGSMVVQVASTRDEGEAKRLVEKLRGQGHVAFYERADLGAKGVWYRVSSGPYADRGTADKVAAQLKQQQYSPMVRAR